MFTLQQLNTVLASNISFQKSQSIVVDIKMVVDDIKMWPRFKVNDRKCALITMLPSLLRETGTPSNHLTPICSTNTCRKLLGIDWNSSDVDIIFEVIVNRTPINWIPLAWVFVKFFTVLRRSSSLP